MPYALRHCAHAFVDVGWEGTPLEPVLYQVWNFGQGRVRRDFQIAVARLEGEPYGVHSSRPLPPMIDRELQRRIRDCVARDLGPAAVARILVETIRAVARQDRTVGRGIIHVCIPRGPVVELESGREYLLSARTPNRDEITFQFLPAHSEDGVPYSPFMVLGGLITPTLILGQNVLRMEMGLAPAETAEEGEDGGNEVATEVTADDDTPSDSETSESEQGSA